MYKTTILIIFLISLSSFINECITLANVCKDISSKSVYLQLKSYLFCDYDADVRPENNKKKTTSIEITVMPKIIEFNDATNILDVHCWTAMNWTDPYLTWNPDDFEGLNSLYISSNDVWVPDIIVHNSGDANDNAKSIPETTCGLNSNGGILCIPAIKYTAHCDTDYTHYPYDIQNCTIELASWSYSSDEILLLLSHGIVMTDFTPNNEWKILKSSIIYKIQDFKMNNSHTSLIYIIQFILQRRGAGIHIVYIVPAIILMVMTLSVLWLDCHSTERMIVAYISFICHLICIQDLYAIIPHNGAALPNILQFYENSFLLMAGTLIITALLREVQNSSILAPQWLTCTTSLILQSKFGQVLLLSILDPKASAFLETSADDRTDLMHAKKNLTWSYVILLLGWLTFISVLFTYIIMLVILLPTRITSIT
ncbi:PREDICTED: neuronal acetylcholine receptor subunit beta-4-like [Ceratosolen solmsi marchali]|uniref:Neuronal acetylcholine receptor subunit beta-4-like n=1 Tax=Ceratosolen solmsi marchali TaxID=326594 RepID=A0AAJ6YDA1_9HYME|nr:PREDICTED: neuronal acetylcholine receptor subunit beta-4-like [Ceratosolen solmsi marchali]